MATRKPQSQIANQTFLFGTAHEPQVSSWFSGCLVQDWDLEHDDFSSMPELKHFAELVRLLYGEGLTKVTCVIGHKPKGVLLAKASGSYQVACKLTAAADYETLEKLSRAAREHTRQDRATDEFYDAVFVMTRILANIPSCDAKKNDALHKSAQRFAVNFTTKSKQQIEDIFTSTFLI